MELQALEVHSLKHLFVNTMIEQILGGKLSIGERLPSEREIAEGMKISRNVVRVGLSELTALGFLRVEPRKGTYVADYLRDGNMLMLDAICRTQVRIPAAILGSLLDFRMTILCESAALCADRRTCSDLARLDGLLAQQQELDDTRNAELTHLDFLLHLELYIISGNRIYPMFHNSVKTLHQMLAAEFYEALPAKTRVRGCHREIVEAIRRREPEAARQWTQEVLELGNEVMKKLSYLSPGTSGEQP